MSITYEINASGNFEQRMARAKEVLDKVDGKVKDWKESTAALGREQQKWLNAIQTPQEKYIQNLNKIKILQEKGKLTAEEAGRAAVKAYDSMIAKEPVIQAELVKRNGLMEKGIEYIKENLTGWAAITAGITAASAALRTYQDIADSSRSRQKTAEEAQGKLQQLAQGKELAGLIAAGRGYSAGAGVDLSEGFDTVNQLANIGAMGSVGTFQAMRRSRMIGEVGTLLPGIQAIQTNAEDAGSVENVLKVALGAAGTSSMNLEPVLQYMPKVASAAQPFGFSFKEVAALTSAQMTAAGSAERGASNAEAMLRELADKGTFTPGQSLESVLSANSQVKFGGEAIRGYRAATSTVGRKNYSAAMQGIEEALASPTFLADRANAGAAVDPYMAAEQRARTREQEYENAVQWTGTVRASQAAGGFAGMRDASGTVAGMLGSRLANNVTGWLPGNETTQYGIALGGGVLGNMAAFGPATPIVNAVERLGRTITSTSPKAPPTATVNP